MSTYDPINAPSGPQEAPGQHAEDRSAQRDRDAARADRERAAEHLARVYRDDLTGALTRRPGREGLEREVNRAHESGTPLALAYADVIGLKRVNDQHGHASGDLLLRAVGEALINNLRPYDIVVRYGGDEFVCALVDSSRDDAARSMQRVMEQLARHDPLAGLSVGYAELRPDDSIDHLVERADNDMYVSRQRTLDLSSQPANGAPQISCLHCDQRMDLRVDAGSTAQNRRYTATCPACRRSVRLNVPETRSRFSSDHAVEPVIALPDRTHSPWPAMPPRPRSS